ncbi:MAG: hypothetical protein LC737_09580 [Chloroflexi bacterium]|nr:hypothetical protein [Chloroflexota bacterium]
MPHVSQLFNICLQPRKTIRALIASPAGGWTEALAIAAVVGDQLVDNALGAPIWGAPLLQNLHLWIIVPVALVPLYLFSAIDWWVAAQLGGGASYEQIRIANTWSRAPLIVVMMPVCLLVALLAPDAVYSLPCVSGLLTLWSGMLYLVCLAEVSGLSKSRAFGAMLTSALVIFAGAMLIGLIIAVGLAILGLAILGIGPR